MSSRGRKDHRRIAAWQALDDAFRLMVQAGRKGQKAVKALQALVEADGQGRLRNRLSVLRQPSLLIVDEIGYLPLSGGGANLFFQLVNARYERASIVLTSNKNFREWGEVFGDSVVAAALLDRLLHHCHIVNIRGNSYKLRNYPGLALPDEEPRARRRRPPRKPKEVSG